MTTLPNAFDWSTVEHANGLATNVPVILARLRSPEEADRRAALAEVTRLLWSDERWWSAQPCFVEALLDLAADPSVPDRHRLLEIVVAILTQGTGNKLAKGLDFNDPSIRKRYAQAIPAAIYRVVADRLAFLAGLLADADPALRAAAVVCLAFIFDAPSVALSPLLEAIRREPDEGVLATMLHSLGLFIRYSGAREDRAVLEAHRASDHPLAVRACACTGTMVFDPGAYTPEVFALFVEAMQLPPLSGERFPLKDGQLDRLLTECVFVIAGGTAPLRELHLTALERGEASSEAQNRWVEAVIAYSFEDGRYALRSDFSEEQIDILERLSRREYDASFYAIGVPKKLSVRRRWLELDGTGPLNWRAPVEYGGDEHEWPVWKAFLVVYEYDPDGRADFLRLHFVPLQILEIHADASFLEWDPEFTDIDYGYGVVAESIDRAGPAALSWALATTVRLLEQPEHAAGFANTSLLPIVRALPEGEALDPRYDAIVLPTSSQHDRAFSDLREVVEKIPLDRREAIFLRHARSHRFAENEFIASFELCSTPNLAKLLLEVLDGRHHPAGPGGINESSAKEMLSSMVQVARTHPEVADVLRSFSPESELLKRELGPALSSFPLVSSLAT